MCPRWSETALAGVFTQTPQPRRKRCATCEIRDTLVKQGGGEWVRGCPSFLGESVTHWLEQWAPKEGISGLDSVSTANQVPDFDKHTPPSRPQFSHL